MLYKANVAVCSEICTKHSTQSEHHVEKSNVNRAVLKPLGFDFSFTYRFDQVNTRKWDRHSFSFVHF